MPKQTAVEWLIEQLEWDDSKIARVIGLKKYNQVVSQAKEMEKQNIENKAIHFAEWLTNKHTLTLIPLYEHFEEQYYNETFKKICEHHYITSADWKSQTCSKCSHRINL